MSERFTVETGAEGTYIIYDNQGPDENYFHLGNDERDIRALCELINSMDDNVKALEEHNHRLVGIVIKQNEIIHKMPMEEIQQIRDNWKEYNENYFK